jgi:serine/threonine protein kinase/Tfp pilus assembly protein PilF
MGIKCPKCHFDNPDDTLYCGKCATPLPSSKEIPVTATLETPTEELTTGTTFAGRYQIIEELGKGGMGRVYKALDTDLKEKVALKLINPEISADKKTIERFQNELKFARKISHRNVCRMYDLNKEEGSYYITMEYVSGEDLKSMIGMMGQLSAGKAISVAKQVCEGLAEAHRLGVVHRDLKPQNIMIDREGNARIMDFGIARSIKGRGITGSGVMIGTPEYMSPEQAEVKEVDQRSDIYSLGVILYEMVTGRVPFEGETPLGIAMKHKSEMPKDPREINTRIPEDISRLILRCMEKDKENRYQSAGEVRSELENIEKGIPTTDRVIPKRKPITSKEITVTFGLKKLLIPALIFIAFIIGVMFIWHPWSKKVIPPLPSSGKTSVAVLPFEDLSPQKDQGYLCDGIAEELINRLNMIENLWVPARTSSFSFKGKGLDIQEIGNKLAVDNVLEGSLRKSGIKLRITVRLVNVADNKSIWYESYNRDEGDIFNLQDEISLAIIENLKIKLMGEEKAKLVKRHTQNPEAYNLYMMGRHFLEIRGREDLNKALEYFEQAIEEDSMYALAYAYLGYTYTTIGDWAYLAPKVAFPNAKKAATKALELDDSLAEAHNALAIVMYIFDWDWRNAEREFKRAIELNPNDATVRQEYAEYLMKLSRFDEAIQEIRRAQELDPLSLIKHAIEGYILDGAGKHDKAIEKLKRVLDMDPEFGPAMVYLGRTYLQKEKYEEAMALFQKMNRPFGIAEAYVKMGNLQEAQQILEEIIKESTENYISPVNIASLYFVIGDNEQGFKWLERGYEEHDTYIVRLRFLPQFDSVRSDPRFKALLKKVGLE